MKMPADTVAAHFEAMLDVSHAPNEVRNEPDVRDCFYDGAYALMEECIDQAELQFSMKTFTGILVDIEAFFSEPRRVDEECALLQKFKEGLQATDGDMVHLFENVFFMGAYAAASILTDVTFERVNLLKITDLVNEINEVVLSRIETIH